MNLFLMANSFGDNPGTQAPKKRNRVPVPGPKPGGGGRSIMSWIFIGMLMILGSIFFFSDDEPSESVDWTTFQTLMEKDFYQKITVYSSKGYIQAVVKKDQVPALAEDRKSVV